MKPPAVIFFFLAAQISAASTRPTDGTSGDVQRKINEAADGDIVTLPAGTKTWTTGVIIPKSKAITLEGAGIGSTIIRDGVQFGPLLIINVRTGDNTKLVRITGIEFQNGGRAKPLPGNIGVIRWVGTDNRTDARVRWDHCKYWKLNGPISANTLIGVWDHLECSPLRGPLSYLHHEFWNGGTHSDKSFSDPIVWGDANWLFIEDCTFTGTGSGIFDAYKGARLVVRHNELHDMTLQTHGTESGGGRSRGVVAIDCYNNKFIGSAGRRGPVAIIRSGVHRFTNNKAINWADPRIGYRCYRLFWDWVRSGFGGADGTNPLDVNQSGGPFYTGTANGNAGPLTVTVDGTPWTDGQWVGYTIKKTTGFMTDFNAGQQQVFSIIIANTSNKITYHEAFRPPKSLSFSKGDQFKLYKVLQAVDQPGRMGGTISGIGPGFSKRSNDQVTSPSYEWDNTPPLTPGLAGDLVIRANEHYFTDHRAPPEGTYSHYTYPHPLQKR